MPTINPPNLQDFYINTFYIPSSITGLTPPNNYLLVSNGSGGTRFQEGGSGGPTNPNLSLSSLTVSSFITASSIATNFIGSSTIRANIITTNHLNISSISTYSMSVYGGNTLTVDGNAYFNSTVQISTLTASTINFGASGNIYMQNGLISTQSLEVSTINGVRYPVMDLSLSTLNVSSLMTTSTLNSYFIGASTITTQSLGVSSISVSSINGVRYPLMDLSLSTLNVSSLMTTST